MKQIITVSSSLVCYTCNEKERFFNVEINLVQQPSAILDRHALLHSNGHEGLGYIYQIVAPVLTQEEIKTNPRLAQCAKYLSVEPRCRNVFAVVLQMLMEKINISAVIPLDTCSPYEDSPWAALYLCWEVVGKAALDDISDYDDVLVSCGSQMTMHSLYCVGHESFTAPSWTWFVTPLDWKIWFLLTISLVLLGLVRTSTKLTAPLNILIYQTTKQLELAGFKMIIKKKEDFEVYELLAGDTYSAMMGKHMTLNDLNYDLDLDYLETMLKFSWLHRIAKSQSYVPIQEGLRNKLGKSEVKIRTATESCFVTEKVFFGFSYKLMVYGSLAVSRDLDRILVRSEEYGITSRWTDMEFTDFVRRLHKESDGEGWEDVTELKLKESIGLVFVLLAVLLSGAGLVYLVEDYKRVILVLKDICKVGRQSLWKLWFKIFRR
ncbi:hypothetical protein Fcan01_23916 [Folsomia candida]|uniref:Uncharacterized protein n=1 Tax=Folsomia candida TaxID=158441 RepID=A0A226D6F1_FOLCA|nr:hypothetical protein Fcan01_23916 [Folsomia candida]